MSKDWNDRLIAAYTTRAAVDERRRRVRLPAKGIEFGGSAQHAVITLEPESVCRNMQEDAAAFEGWSLVLRHWCQVERVTLRWTPFTSAPPSADGRLTLEERHYQRFLYRVRRFLDLFPDWFDVGQEDDLSHSKVIDRTAYLNAAGKRADDPTDLREAKPEARLEYALKKDMDFRRAYCFADPKIDRQFPVGLFSAPRPSIKSAIFPGGKGAIDLVCREGSHLWLFELKAEGNISVGTLSELLLYVSLARDVAMKKIGFSEDGSHHGDVKAGDFASASAITGVMLGHNLHPLLSDPGIFSLLNDAAGVRWNTGDAPPVDFIADRIKGNFPNGDPFAIEREGSTAGVPCA